MGLHLFFSLVLAGRESDDPTTTHQGLEVLREPVFPISSTNLLARHRPTPSSRRGNAPSLSMKLPEASKPGINEP